MVGASRAFVATAGLFLLRVASACSGPTELEPTAMCRLPPDAAMTYEHTVQEADGQQVEFNACFDGCTRSAPIAWTSWDCTVLSNAPAGGGLRSVTVQCAAKIDCVDPDHNSGSYFFGPGSDAGE